MIFVSFSIKTLRSFFVTLSSFFTFSVVTFVWLFMMFRVMLFAAFVFEFLKNKQIVQTIFTVGLFWRIMFFIPKVQCIMQLRWSIKSESITQNANFLVYDPGLSP